MIFVSSNPTQCSYLFADAPRRHSRRSSTPNDSTLNIHPKRTGTQCVVVSSRALVLRWILTPLQSPNPVSNIKHPSLIFMGSLLYFIIGTSCILRTHVLKVIFEH